MIKHAVILKLQYQNGKENNDFYNEYTKRWVKDIAQISTQDLLCSVQNDNEYEIVADKNWNHLLLADVEHENGDLERLKINEV